MVHPLGQAQVRPGGRRGSPQSRDPAQEELLGVADWSDPLGAGHVPGR